MSDLVAPAQTTVDNLDSLINKLNANANDETKKEVLLNYLRGSTLPKSEALKADVQENKCYGYLEDGNASQCGTLIEKCLKGDGKECAESMASVTVWSKQVDKLEKSQARTLLAKLGVDDKHVNAQAWVDSLPSELKDGIAKNTALTQFVNAAIVLVRGRVPVAQSRFAHLQPKQAGGGNFNQFIDRVKLNTDMVGGGHAVLQAPMLLNKYNEFKRALASKQKSIESADDKKILELIDALERSEGRLLKITEIIEKYRSVLNHPELKDKSTVNVDELNSLIAKAEAESTKLKVRTGNIISVITNLDDLVSKIVKTTLAEQQKA